MSCICSAYTQDNLTINKVTINFEEYSNFKGTYILVGKGEGALIPAPDNIKILKFNDSNAIGVNNGTVVFEIKEISYQKTKEQLLSLFYNLLRLDKEEINLTLRERGGIDFNHKVEVNINPEAGELWWLGQAKANREKSVLIYMKIVQNNSVIMTYYL